MKRHFQISRYLFRNSRIKNQTDRTIYAYVGKGAKLLFLGENPTRTARVPVIRPRNTCSAVPDDSQRTWIVRIAHNLHVRSIPRRY